MEIQKRKSQARHLEVITFDCYGTLIDWETGIRNAFRQAIAKNASENIPETKVFELYEEEERRIQKEGPYRSYRSVLSLAALAVAKRTGWRLAEARSHFLAEALPKWTPFPDTNPALERLSRRHKLGILSNVDNDLLEGTRKHLTVPFDIIVTAETVNSYKPGPAHFEQARRIIGDHRGWLHVAASQYHDIEPATRLGINAVWVNRKYDQPMYRHSKETIKKVKDLTQLADWLDA